LISNEIDNMIK